MELLTEAVTVTKAGYQAGSARLGLAQLELARYGNELARIGSLTNRAKRQARLGLFSSSSRLIWLASQLE